MHVYKWLQQASKWPRLYLEANCDESERLFKLDNKFSKELEDYVGDLSVPTGEWFSRVVEKKINILRKHSTCPGVFDAAERPTLSGTDEARARTFRDVLTKISHDQGRFRHVAKTLGPDHPVWHLSDKDMLSPDKIQECLDDEMDVVAMFERLRLVKRSLPKYTKYEDELDEYYRSPLTLAMLKSSHVRQVKEYDSARLQHVEKQIANAVRKLDRTYLEQYRAKVYVHLKSEVRAAGAGADAGFSQDSGAKDGDDASQESRNEEDTEGGDDGDDVSQESRNEEDAEGGDDGDDASQESRSGGGAEGAADGDDASQESRNEDDAEGGDDGDDASQESRSGGGAEGAADCDDASQESRNEDDAEGGDDGDDASQESRSGGGAEGAADGDDASQESIPHRGKKCQNA